MKKVRKNGKWVDAGGSGTSAGASVSITIEVSDEATPALAKLSGRLRNRAGLNAFIAADEEKLFSSYIRTQASLRHRTAQALGATPTGELERAAASPEGTSDENGVKISLRPGHLFSRAFRDVTIKPSGGKKYLTIPVNAAAYGKRAGEFGKSLRFMRVGPKKTAILAVPGDKGRQFETMYVLVPSARQKQDRILLPSDADITAIAEEAADHFLHLDDEYKGGAS